MSERKEFTTIDNQMDLLENRGIHFPNRESGKRYLLTNNYYNIINGYSKYFQETDNEQKDLYKKGTSFDEICRLYSFDKEVKQTLLNAILHAEHHLKSIFAYRFAEAYPNKRYSYLDINCYSSEKTLQVGYVISKISKIINKNKKYPNNSIYHYVKNYKDVPVWVIVDFLDFGDLASLIRSVPHFLQNKIALDFVSFIKMNNSQFSEQYPAEVMISFIKNIQEIRNVCAHNNRILDFQCRSDSIFFPALHDQYGICQDDLRRRTYSTFVSLQCFLSYTEFAILNNTLRKRFQQLSNHLNTIDINSISSSLGFPDDWHKAAPLKQNS